VAYSAERVETESDFRSLFPCGGEPFWFLGYGHTFCHDEVEGPCLTSNIEGYGDEAIVHYSIVTGGFRRDFSKPFQRLLQLGVFEDKDGVVAHRKAMEDEHYLVDY